MRRIQRDQKYEPLVKVLSEGEDAIFREKWRVLIFAAMIGYRLDLRLPISSAESGKAIPVSYFEGNPSFRGLIYLLALVEAGDTACLSSTESSDDALVTMFEEFANGGLRYLNEEIGDSSDVLNKLLDIAMRFGLREQKAVEADLSGLL